MTQQDLEARIYAFLRQKYVQSATQRQREMGLQYTTAETRDLAKQMARFFTAETAPLQKKRVIPERWLGDDEAGACGEVEQRQIGETLNRRVAEDQHRVHLMLALWPAWAGEAMLVYDHRHNLVGLAQAISEWKVGEKPKLLVSVDEISPVSF